MASLLLSLLPSDATGNRFHGRSASTCSLRGGSFASNAAAWWGFHYHDLIEEPTPREVITISELRMEGEQNWPRAVYTFRWTPQADPFGVVHSLMAHLACRPMRR
jgi:hypothetical protein